MFGAVRTLGAFKTKILVFLVLVSPRLAELAVFATSGIFLPGDADVAREALNVRSGGSNDSGGSSGNGGSDYGSGHATSGGCGTTACGRISCTAAFTA